MGLVRSGHSSISESLHDAQRRKCRPKRHFALFHGFRRIFKNHRNYAGARGSPIPSQGRDGGPGHAASPIPSQGREGEMRQRAATAQSPSGSGDQCRKHGAALPNPPQRAETMPETCPERVFAALISAPWGKGGWASSRVFTAFISAP